MNRLVIVPDETTEPLVQILKSRLAAVAGEIKAEHYSNLLNSQCKRALVAFVRSRQDQELILWGGSDGAYRVAWTSMPPEAEVLHIVTAARESGPPAQVWASGHSVMQHGDELQAGSWTNLEERRGRGLASLIACPVALFGKCAGVLTLGKYRSQEEPQPPAHEEAVELAETAALLARLLEDRLIRSCLGLESL